MATGYVLYNTKAGSNTTPESIKALQSSFYSQLEFIDVTQIEDYASFVSKLDAEDFIIIAGGDGTLNRFANETYDIDIKNEILYFPNGTGNDFATDLGYTRECKPFAVNEHLKNLPTVTVNGNDYHFINGVGYGIDGYCCEVGDKMKASGSTKVNYTAIAIKGLLFYFKPVKATITVDGKKYDYKNVWLVPTMNGRYYGGGMIPTPAQSRANQDGILSTLVFRGASKIKTLMIFPSIFKGEHIKHEKAVTILTGHEITVEFDRPCALQIDGETILNVTSYTATSNKLATVK
ncbi:MAG: diacylglycerol kinase family protein [Clostridia bacterium]|nr:diacylglycerol kinase family protein [Clostridia bacterium]